MSGLKSLAALIGGIGVGLSGYAKGQAQFQQNERQKKLDARDDEQYERSKAKQDKADKLESDLAASQADQVAQAVPSYDITSIGGGDPDKQPTVGYQAGGQFFADKAQADQALVGANSRAEKAKRAADLYASAGDFDRATKMQQLMDMHIKEGTDQALARIQQGAPQLAELDKAGGRVLAKVGQDTADLYNNIGGRFKVSADTAVEYFKDKNAAGQEFVNARVLGKDGKPVVDDVNGAMMMFLSAKERLAARNDDARTYQQGLQITEQKRANEAREGQAKAELSATIADRAANRGIQMQGLGLQRERLNMEKESFKRQTVDGQLEMIEKTLGGKMPKEQRDQVALELYGLSKKKGGTNPTALADKLTETYATNTMDATPAKIAQFRAGLIKEFGQVEAKNQAAEELHANLGKYKPGTPEYAKEYADAKTELNLKDEDLRRFGFPPPPKGEMTKNPVQAVGVKPPSAPAPKATPPREPFKPMLRDTPESIAKQKQEVLQRQAAPIQAEIVRLQGLLKDPKVDEFYKKQYRAQIDARQNELIQLGR